MGDPLNPAALFTHRYDIDDIILALCGPAPRWLDTRNGLLHDNPVEGGRCYEIAPLPPSTPSWLAEHPDVRVLLPEERADLDVLLCEPLTAYPTLFDRGRAGGWLRARLKELAMDWLSAQGLIPPSLDAINRHTTPPGAGTAPRVIIQ